MRGALFFLTLDYAAAAAGWCVVGLVLLALVLDVEVSDCGRDCILLVVVAVAVAVPGSSIFVVTTYRCCCCWSHSTGTFPKLLSIHT